MATSLFQTFPKTRRTGTRPLSSERRGGRTASKALDSSGEPHGRLDFAIDFLDAEESTHLGRRDPSDGGR